MCCTAPALPFRVREKIVQHRRHRSHQFPRHLDALAKKGASVFPAVNDWRKMDQITWGHQHTCCSGCTTQRLSSSRKHFDRCTPNPKTRAHHPGERIIALTGSRWQRASLPCANILHQGVELWIGFGIPSAQDRPALILPILCASAIRCFMSRIG